MQTSWRGVRRLNGVLNQLTGERYSMGIKSGCDVGHACLRKLLIVKTVQKLHHWHPEQALQTVHQVPQILRAGPQRYCVSEKAMRCISSAQKLLSGLSLT